MLYMVRLRARFVSRVCLENMPYSGIIFNRIPPANRVRQPHSAKNPYLPKQKNFPHVPAILKSETNFHFLNGGDMGEVLGRSGRFGG